MKRIIMASITAVVVIAVLAGTLIPILDDATATHDTIVNDGYFRLDKITDSSPDSYHLQWTVSNPDVVTVNDTDLSIDLNDAPSQITLVFNDDWMLRANIANGHIAEIEYGRGAAGTGATATSSIDATMNGGTLAIVIDGVSATSSTYETAYIPSDSGSYIMKRTNGTAFIFEDSEVVAFGLTRLNTYNNGSYYVGIKFAGDITEITPTAWRGGSSVTFTDLTVNYTESDDYVDLLELSNIKFNANLTEGDNVTTTLVTYSYFLVPYQVTAEKIVHFTDGENAIFNAIPVMIIIALLLGVVALVLRSRMD